MDEKRLRCPICGSRKIKEVSEYADNKKEGEKASKGGNETVEHYCLICEKYFIAE